MDESTKRGHILIDSLLTKFPEDRASCTSDAQAAFLAGALAFAWQVAVATGYENVKSVNDCIESLSADRERGVWPQAEQARRCVWRSSHL